MVYEIYMFDIRIYGVKGFLESVVRLGGAPMMRTTQYWRFHWVLPVHGKSDLVLGPNPATANPKTTKSLKP